MSREHIWLSGCAGFIGSALLAFFCQNKYKVVGVDNFSVGKLENVKQWLKKLNGVKIVTADLKNPKSRAFDYLDSRTTVLHFAGNSSPAIGYENPKIDLENNLLVTFNLLEAMRKKNCKRLIFPSSGTIYGIHDCSTVTWSFPKPISIYAATKHACEDLIYAYCHTFDFQALILRLANIVGPGVTHGLLYDKLREKPPLKFKGFPNQSKQYVYIDDLVDFISTHMGAVKNPPNIMNISNVDAITLKEIAEMFGKKFSFSNRQSWPGDIHSFFLRTDWNPLLSSKEAYTKALNLAKKQL